MALNVDVQEWIKKTEADSHDLSELEIAKMILAEMTASQKRSVLLDALSAMVWEVRRARQLEIERRAAQESAERQKRVEEKRNQEWADGRETRLEQEHMRYVESYDAASVECQKWIDDPESFPVDLSSAAQKYDRMAAYPHFRSDIMSVLAGDDLLSRIRVYDYGWYFLRDEAKQTRSKSGLDWESWIRAVARRDGLSTEELIDILGKVGLVSSAFSLTIENEVEKQAKRIRLEITEELLGSEFALGDGVRVTWGEATVEQHAQRVEMTTKNAVANAQDASRHRAAILLIESKGVTSLAEVSREKVSA